MRPHPLLPARPGHSPSRHLAQVGSSCTISGLVVGVALSRRLGLAAFRSDSFTIVGVIVHHLFAAAERGVGLHTAPWARAVPERPRD